MILVGKVGTNLCCLLKMKEDTMLSYFVTTQLNRKKACPNTCFSIRKHEKENTSNKRKNYINREVLLWKWRASPRNRSGFYNLAYRLEDRLFLFFHGTHKAPLIWQKDSAPFFTSESPRDTAVYFCHPNIPFRLIYYQMECLDVLEC